MSGRLPHAEPRIVDLVFDRRGRRARFATIAAIATLTSYAFAGAALVRWEGQRRRARAEAPPPLQEFVIEQPALTPPPPPPPAAAAPADPPAHATAPRPVRVARLAQKAPAPPAAAASVVAQDPAAPIDLTGGDIITGPARTHAGGVTASSGTGAHPAQPSSIGNGSGAGGSRARAVSLEESDWHCPWPREAEAAEANEETAIIRVIVAASGHALSARVIRERGIGFGRAAVACALETRFLPATDSEGRATQAESPPIRVKFTR